MKSKPTIVLLDDDKWITDLYSDKLKMEGFRVFVANNGKDGFKLIIEHRPDLVLTDIVMPKGDGFYVLKKIKETEEVKNVPVITLTNIASEHDKQQGIELGACDYLMKAENTPSQVVKKIRTVLKENC